MTLKRYIVLAVLAFVVVWIVLIPKSTDYPDTPDPLQEYRYPLLLLPVLVTAVFIPTIYAWRNDHRHRIAITIFNFVFFPIAWLIWIKKRNGGTHAH